MRQHILGAALLLLACLFAETVEASTLKVDGQISVVKTMGDSIVITVQGRPGMPVTLLADVLPGPVQLLGSSLDIGFTPLLAILPISSIPGGGTLTMTAKVPALPTLDGQHIYLLAVVHDPTFPYGFDFSNGADFLIEAPPSAGANQGTIVGRRVVLDGSDVALPNGLVEPGKSIYWFLSQAPGGSAAKINDPTRPFATLTPDVPGDYVVQASIQTPTGSYAPKTTVHAWQIQTTPLKDGSVSIITTFPVTGVVTGPPLKYFAMDGKGMGVDLAGNFGPFNVTFGAGEVVDTHVFRMTHADGSTANHKMTVFFGANAYLSNAYPKPLSAQVNESGLNLVADVGEQELQATDLKALLLALPPQQIANEKGPFGITLFSATIDFDNLTYNSNVQLTLDPQTGGIVGVVKIYSVKAYFSVWGKIIGIGYDLDGDITTSPLVITANLVGSASNGKLKVDVAKVDVDSQNFKFNLNGFLGSVAELFIIESSVKEAVEDTVASAVKAELGPALAEVLGAFELKGSLLKTLLVDIDVAAPISGVVHSSHGVTIQLDARTTVNSAEPGSPAVTTYRTTSSLPPTFGALSPASVPYAAALSLGDDFVNQVLAAATAAGLLDGDLTMLFDDSPRAPPITFLTDQLAVLFPGCGFEHWPVGTAVDLVAHGTVPPTLELTPGAATMGTVHLSNLEVEIEVETAYGPIPHLLVSLSGAADVNLSLATGGTLAATLVSSTVALEVLRIYPGADPVTMDTQVGLLGAALTFLMPDLIGAIGAIPLPSLEAQGLGLQPTELVLFGPNTQHVGMFGNLLLKP